MPQNSAGTKGTADSMPDHFDGYHFCCSCYRSYCARRSLAVKKGVSRHSRLHDIASGCCAALLLSKLAALHWLAGSSSRTAATCQLPSGCHSSHITFGGALRPNSEIVHVTVKARPCLLPLCCPRAINRRICTPLGWRLLNKLLRNRGSVPFRSRRQQNFQNMAPKRRRDDAGGGAGGSGNNKRRYLPQVHVVGNRAAQSSAHHLHASESCKRSAAQAMALSTGIVATSRAAKARSSRKTPRASWCPA